MYDYGYGYDYSYDYGSTGSSITGILTGVSVVVWVIYFGIIIFSLVSMWKLFTKAGKKGWAAIVPIYNMIVMIQIAELPMWYIALFFVPIANIYAMFKIYIEIAHKFGKSTGFGVGMVFLSVIFIPMLAFGKAEYKGGVGAPVNNNVNPQPSMQNDMQYNPVNEQVNMPNNNLQSNVMDVNSGVGAQPMFDVNMQNNDNSFQPIGNVNNNVGNINVAEPTGVNDVMPSVNNVGFGVDMNNSVVSPISSVPPVSEPVMANPVNNMEPVNNTVVQPMDNNVVSPVSSVPPVSEPVMANPVNNMEPVDNMMVQSMDNNVVSPASSVSPISESAPNVQVNNVETSINQNNSMTKTCPNCGNQVDFSAMFCTNCGHNL